jgi:putative hydrolase of the HAD superfamily
MKAVIFDLDNTLLDLMRMKEMCIEASIDAMIDAGLEMPRRKALAMFRKMYYPKIEDQRIFQKFLAKATGKVDPRMLAYAIIAYRRVKAGFLHPYPGAKMTLIELKNKGLKLAVVSDAPRDQAWLRLATLKLDDFFDTVVTFDDTGEKKPSRKPFMKALRALGVKPEDALMVGDWPERDMVGAKKLGMKTAFAKYGSIKRYRRKVADFELERITDLLRIL